MPDLAKRFEAAVSALVGEGSVKDRLVAAYSEHLDDVESSELPQAVRTAFEELHTALHAVTPTGGEPCVRATIRKMSKLQVGNHARTIVSLYAELICQGERAEPLMVIAPTAEVEGSADFSKTVAGNLQKH
jgi:hypothetical protein